MKLIVIIDDSAVHRRLAAHELSTRSGIFIPGTSAQVEALDPRDVGFLVLDRHLARDWRLATDALLARIGSDVEVVEWTAATRFDTRDKLARAIQTLAKTGPASELSAAVNRWIEYGTTLEMAVA